MTQPKASPHLLTVQAPTGDTPVGRALARLGQVEELQGAEGLLLLRLKGRPSDAKAAWQRVRKALGPAATVQPVLVDDRGEEQYPTGEIVVRFNEPPTDATLTRFAKRHDLRVRERNAYVPQQVVFEPAHPGEQYLPDVVAGIEGGANVKMAWPNTRSRYRRS